MPSDSAKTAGSSSPDPAHRAQVGPRHFMLTLCRLAAPVAIRPPPSPQLEPFTFFMSRAPQPDGSERLYLHLGYFETLADAERWVEAVRHHYPNAFATIAPVMGEPLTDTQMMKILAARRVAAVEDDVDESNGEQIALLRPDDTGTRQALKEAIAQGAPVSFALQLHWSAQPIDLSSVPSLAIFKPYTLYATESRREGHSHHFLRLGFFADPISAKQVAVEVRSSYASAAVVPVLEHEVTRAREASMGNSAIPYFVRQRADQGTDSQGTTGTPGTAGAPTQARPLSDAARRVARGAEAAKSDPDSLSESGVRHLRVEVQEHATGRWRIVHLDATPPDLGQVDS